MNVAAPPATVFELAPGVLAAFTTRSGGVSRARYASLNMSGAVGDDPAAVARNRELAAHACGLSRDALTWMKQVHGNRVGCAAGSDDVRIEGDGRIEDDGRTEEAGAGLDALYTDVPGLALGVLAADCAPVLIADPVRRVVGVAHAGRAGTASGVVPALVAAMSRAGAEPGRMRAVAGPAICGGCYEVGAAVQEEVAAAVPQTQCTTRAGSAGLDIRAGIAAQLASAGVTQVRIDPRCTAETPGLYSYRRDGQTGRFAGLAWLEA
jgi:hypothetical protein